MRLSDTPALTIHPGFQFGRVCLNRSRTPAESVAWSVWAEPHHDAQLTAEDYGTTRNEALLACWWFVITGVMHSARGQSKRKRQWEAWADHAGRVLGGWDKRTRKLCNPDDYVAPA